MDIDEEVVENNVFIHRLLEYFSVRCKFALCIWFLLPYHLYCDIKESSGWWQNFAFHVSMIFSCCCPVEHRSRTRTVCAAVRAKHKFSLRYGWESQLSSDWLSCIPHLWLFWLIENDYATADGPGDVGDGYFSKVAFRCQNLCEISSERTSL